MFARRGDEEAQGLLPDTPSARQPAEQGGAPPLRAALRAAICRASFLAVGSVALAVGGSLYHVHSGADDANAGRMLLNGTSFTADDDYQRMLRTAEGVLKDRFAGVADKAERELRREAEKVMAEERAAKARGAHPHPRSRGPAPGADDIPTPPPGITRTTTQYGWCTCGKGTDSVMFWPKGDMGDSRTVQANSAMWVNWSKPVQTVRWICDGMYSVMETTVDLRQGQWLSVQLSPSAGDHRRIGFCDGRDTGLVKFNKWQSTDYPVSIPFTTGTGGYFCFKIPSLLHTTKGTLIAFTEGRKDNCSDYAATVLLYRRSSDGGRTWGSLRSLLNLTVEDQQTKGICGKPLVVGNIAPVQMRSDSKYYPGRILAPYMRNNFKTWLVYSDDDGVTWTGDRELVNMTVTDPGVSYEDAQPECERGMDYFGFDIDYIDTMNWANLARWAAQICYDKKNIYDRRKWASKLVGPWQFIGTGPSKALQLRSGRVLVPAYHGYIHALEGSGIIPISQLYSSVALGHTLITDDGGDTWRMSDDWDRGDGACENEMVELHDSVLANIRSLSTGTPQYRLQARSFDDGESFEASEFIEIPSPFNGAYGSTISDGNRTVYTCHSDPLPAQSWVQDAFNAIHCNINGTGRTRLSVWKSTTEGRDYPDKVLLDPGASGQNSFQWVGDKLMLLYEQSDPAPVYSVESILVRKAIENLEVQLPDRFVLREVGVDI